jgi:UDP-N-acetylglucosamine acyltransferase
MTLKRAYKIIYRQQLTVKQALEKLEDLVAEASCVQALIDALRASTRGIVR